LEVAAYGEILKLSVGGLGEDSWSIIERNYKPAGSRMTGKQKGALKRRSGRR
jgi:hypothetical protein